MKRKILTVILSVVALAFCALGLSACDFFGNSESGTEQGGTEQGGTTGGEDVSAPTEPSVSLCNHSGNLRRFYDESDPSCTKEGYELNVLVCCNVITEYGKQVVCGTVFSGEGAGTQLGRIYNLTEYDCDVMCEQGANYYFFEQYRTPIEKLPHTPVTDAAVPSTCSTKGLTEGSHCEVCNTVLKAQQETDYSDHDYSDELLFSGRTYYLCNGCGNVENTEDYFKVKLNDDKNSYTLVGVSGQWTSITFSDFKSYNGKPITAIGRDAFLYNETLRYVKIDGDITSIGAECFASCTALETVIIGEGITEIPRISFIDCENLKNVTIADSVTSVDVNLAMTISASPFRGCPIETVTAPEHLLTYLNNEHIKKVKVTSGTGQFNTSLYSVMGLSGCTNLTEITFADGVTGISDELLSNCTSLERIDIAGSVTLICNEAFKDCTSLTDIYFYGTAAQWAEIVKGRDWNENTGNYVVHCNDGVNLDKDGNVI